jgi:uncharacterized protein (DUF433 family)
MFSLPEAGNIPLRTDEDGVIRVGQTRVTLQTVIADFRRGASPEEIVHHYPALGLADTYLVLGYYLQHPDEIDGYLLEQRQLADQARQEYESQHPADPLRAKLLNRLQESKKASS